VQSGSHAQELPQLDLCFPRVIQRQRLGKIFLVEDFLIEPARDTVMELLEHDAARHARVSLADRGHGGNRLAIAAAVVLLIDEPAVTGDQQATVLAAPRSVLERLIELGDVHAGRLAHLLRCF